MGGGAQRVSVAVQSAYYLLTGVWPILAPGSFQAVTGPKSEMWLVKTFGALVAANGIGLGLAALRDKVEPEVRLLAGGSAATLAAADIYYVATGRIANTYLVDAVLQLGFLPALVPTRSRASLSTGPVYRPPDR